MMRILKFYFLVIIILFFKSSFSQVSKVAVFYNTGKIYHDISQFPYHQTDFFGGINTGLEFNIHKKWNVGIMYTHFYMHRQLQWQLRQERTYTLITDNLFSFYINKIQKIGKKLEWQGGFEPTLRFAHVYWADEWTQGGVETVILRGGFYKRKEIGFKLSTAIRYFPLKNDRFYIDIYAKRSFFQNTPNFSQLGLGVGYAFYKKKQ